MESAREVELNVDALIRAIERKLEENRATLMRSKGYGRLSWRLTKEGFAIKLEPEL